MVMIHGSFDKREHRYSLHGANLKSSAQELDSQSLEISAVDILFRFLAHEFMQMLFYIPWGDIQATMSLGVHQQDIYFVTAWAQTLPTYLAVFSDLDSWYSSLLHIKLPNAVVPCLL